MARREGIPLKIWLDETTLAMLKAYCRRRGIELLPECAATLIRESLEAESPQYDVDRLAKRLERAIQDLLNPFTGKIDEINRRLAELIESLEAEESREQPLPQPSLTGKQTTYERAERTVRRHTAMERLKDEGVVFEEDIRWMKAPTRFFQKLEREGAIVLDIHGEKVAVDPDFWREFKEVIAGIQISDLSEASNAIEEQLGVNASRLFRKLARAGLLHFNEEKGIWELSDKISKY
ncbi:MAG: hypothetical protein LRS46_03945 [Desulfurococcales archaeon]|nr:hypothetical protein [Desulfurococcales archaeon]